MRDGKILDRLSKRLIWMQTATQHIREWRRSFPDKNFAVLAILGPRFSIRSIWESSPHFVREWRSTFGTRNVRSPSSRIPTKTPPIDMETATGLRDAKKRLFFRIVLTLPAGRPITYVLRQNATTCDTAMICGKRRRITAFDDNASVPRLPK